MRIHVGIDAGTSSAKISARNGEELVCEFKRNYAEENDGEDGVQNVKIILEIVMELLEKTKTLLESKNLKIDKIWTCGQMHGIVLWSADDLLTYSPLYNWTFSKSQNFLKNLPVWKDAEIHPGFGLTTLAYLYHSDPESLKPYNRCGTIMDLLNSILTSNKTTVFISHHNAFSWGYCSQQDATWQPEIFDFLPNWIELPTVTRDNRLEVGSWHGAKCHVASGDLQASVASLEFFESTAYLILGTSAQLCCLVNPDEIPTTVPPTVVQLPYSSTKKLMAACAMNGGNALEAVLKVLEKSSKEKLSTLPELLEQLEKNAIDIPANLKIDPIFIPERGISKQLSIEGVTSETSDLQILEATHRGILQNLFSLFPISVLKSLKIQNLALVGAAQSDRFKRHLHQICDGANFNFTLPKSAISTPMGATRF